MYFSDLDPNPHYTVGDPLDPDPQSRILQSDPDTRGKNRRKLAKKVMTSFKMNTVKCYYKQTKTLVFLMYE